MKAVLLRSLSAVFRLLSSLKLAVSVMLVLALSMTTATVLESLYDTPTAQYWVYRSFGFHFALFLLGVNIFCVAMSRLPWKRRHGPFLMAHLGILMLLTGSWVTWHYGLDGTLRLEEGQASTSVELNQPLLYLVDGAVTKPLPIRWTPPHATFRPIEVPEYGLKVDAFMAFADANVSFAPADEREPQVGTAIQVQLAGGPMRIRQDYWLWSADSSWSRIQAGPSTLRLVMPGEKVEDSPQGPGPLIHFLPQSDGSVRWWARSSSGEVKKGSVPAAQVPGAVIEPGWKGNVSITLKQLLPRAATRVTYEPSRIQYGPQAPPSAIHVVAGQGAAGNSLWLGLGDRATLEVAGRPVGVAYLNQRQKLPFWVKLDHFQIDYYEGSRDPKSYASRVSVFSAAKERLRGDVEISMNEPLEHEGLKFYQASYEPGEPRPRVSILSVNRDPGRPLKYWGSLLIVLGSIWLFGVKVRQSRSRARSGGVENPA